jgi:hypothetical protein
MSFLFSSVSTRRLCFWFLSIKSPVVLSLFTKLWIVCLLGTLSSRNFCRHFLVDPYISHSCQIEIHAALKYTVPWRTTLLTNCNWEEMANGADNCCLHSFIHQWLYSPFVGLWPLLQFRNLFYTVGRNPWTSDQLVARHLPIHRTTQTSMPRVGITTAYCWEIINKLPCMNHPARRETQCGQAVGKLNYFPSFQTLSAIRHPDWAAKFVCAPQLAMHRSPWIAEPWTGEQNKKKTSSVLCHEDVWQSVSRSIAPRTR